MFFYFHCCFFYNFRQSLLLMCLLFYDFFPFTVFALSTTEDLFWIPPYMYKISISALIQCCVVFNFTIISMFHVNIWKKTPIYSTQYIVQTYILLLVYITYFASIIILFIFYYNSVSTSVQVLYKDMIHLDLRHFGFIVGWM